MPEARVEHTSTTSPPKPGARTAARLRPALLLAIALTTPVLVVYAGHAYQAWRQGVAPTFLIQLDMAYYLANARQYVDGQHAWGAYSNPYDSRADSPRIYFQPLTLGLAIAHLINPPNPGLVFLALGVVCAVLSFVVLNRLIAEYCAPVTWLGGAWVTAIVAWGSGVLVLAGAVLSLFKTGELDPFFIDPGGGWWFLSLGRNFLYPTEGFYHLIVLGLFLAVLRGRLALVAGLALLLAVSHPFTGLQYSLIVLAWIVIERMLDRGQSITIRTVATFCIPLVFVIGYYLVFLPRYPSHRALMEQWMIHYSLTLEAAAAAHLPVAILVLIGITRLSRPSFQSPFERFLAVAFVISSLLAVHDVFIDPRQPLHFTRGHTWLPLALLASPLMLSMWNRWREHPTSVARTAAMLTFTIGMLIDNATFVRYVAVERPTMVLTPVERRVLDAADRQYRGSVILSDVQLLEYLAATFTSLRPYYGHWANTPWADLRRTEMATFLQTGDVPSDLCDENIVVVTRKATMRFERDRRFVRVLQDEDLALFTRQQPRTGCE